MDKPSLIFSIIMLVSGTYWIILGWYWYNGKKYLDVISILSLWFIRKIQGNEVSEQYKKRILTTRNFKFYGVYLIGSGILQLFFGITIFL
jgi:hypothetical protein